MPTSNLKTRKAGQFGARAQASVHIQNMTKVPTISQRRPNCSDNGAQTIGPEDFVIIRGRSLEALKKGLYLPKIYPGERLYVSSTFKQSSRDTYQNPKTYQQGILQ